jgi:hypothetical protein
MTYLDWPQGAYSIVLIDFAEFTGQNKVNTVAASAVPVRTDFKLTLSSSGSTGAQVTTLHRKLRANATNHIYSIEKVQFSRPNNPRRLGLLAL